MKLFMSCAAIAVATVLAGPAAAADLGGNCCADLEERIAELEATTVRKGNRKVKLELSGQVNEAVMWWDDGGSTTTESSNVYVGTNDVSRTRFRFKGEAKVDDKIKAGYLLEIGVRGNRLSRTDQTTDEGIPTTVNTSLASNAFDVRHSAWWLEHKDLGRVWLGQTSQAADGVTEVNLANMNHFARISASKWNMSNRIIVNGVLSDRRWRDLLPADGFTGDNVPGEGDRHSLIKYVSPKYHGFEFSAAWGEDDFWDVALRYAGEFGGFKIAAAVGYAEYTDANLVQDAAGAFTVNESLRGCAVPSVANGNAVSPGSDNACNQLGGSISLMHTETGLFLTVGGGVKDDELRDFLFRNRAVDPGDIDEQDWFWGLHAGIEKKFHELGKTTLYGEYAKFEAGAQIGDTDGSRRSFNVAFPDLGAGSNRSLGSEVWYWGVGVNQHIDKAAMDFYLAYRHHEGEITLFDDAAPGNVGTFGIQDIDIIMTGSRIQF